uniref:Uncharacterized protein n=1 Tax=Timema shepardi TaxID=629360 RepID=A0A7R9AW53_TIMSH|nr:unnamed protein product [Timema shepardi]
MFAAFHHAHFLSTHIPESWRAGEGLGVVVAVSWSLDSVYRLEIAWLLFTRVAVEGKHSSKAREDYNGAQVDVLKLAHSGFALAHVRSGGGGDNQWVTGDSPWGLGERGVWGSADGRKDAGIGVEGKVYGREWERGSRGLIRRVDLSGVPVPSNEENRVVPQLHVREFAILTFTPRLFFLVLLPPVILESAYSLYDQAFACNFNTILLNAVVVGIVSLGDGGEIDY